MNSDGTVDTSRSKNITGSNVTHTTMSGIYCFDSLGFTASNVVAIAEASDRTVHVFGQTIGATE